MAAEGFLEGSQVVTVFRGSDGHVLARDHDDIADAVSGQFKPIDHLFLVDHQDHVVDCVKPCHDFSLFRIFGQIGCGKSTQRTVVDDVRVGNRQDHAGLIFA